MCILASVGPHINTTIAFNAQESIHLHTFRFRFCIVHTHMQTYTHTFKQTYFRYRNCRRGKFFTEIFCPKIFGKLSVLSAKIVSMFFDQFVTKFCGNFDIFFIGSRHNTSSTWNRSILFGPLSRQEIFLSSSSLYNQTRRENFRHHFGFFQK